MDTRTRTAGSDLAPLGLSNVLVNSLPDTLLLDGAPDDYTVEAIFSRRPAPEEISQLLSPATHSYLARAGYPNVHLEVADRRLRIGHASLEQLRDGLAGAIATRLAEIGREIGQQHEASAARLRESVVRDAERAAAVVALAGSVEFQPQPVEGRDASAEQASDDARTTDWEEEGGRAR
jgi:hypothetical protein